MTTAFFGFVTSTNIYSNSNSNSRRPYTGNHSIRDDLCGKSRISSHHNHNTLIITPGLRVLLRLDLVLYHLSICFDNEPVDRPTGLLYINKQPTKHLLRSRIPEITSFVLLVLLTTCLPTWTWTTTHCHAGKK